MSYSNVIDRFTNTMAYKLCEMYIIQVISLYIYITQEALTVNKKHDVLPHM